MPCTCKFILTTYFVFFTSQSFVHVRLYSFFRLNLDISEVKSSFRSRDCSEKDPAHNGIIEGLIYFLFPLVCVQHFGFPLLNFASVDVSGYYGHYILVL